MKGGKELPGKSQNANTSSASPQSQQKASTIASTNTAYTAEAACHAVTALLPTNPLPKQRQQWQVHLARPISTSCDACICTQQPCTAHHTQHSTPTFRSHLRSSSSLNSSCALLPHSTSLLHHSQQGEEGTQFARTQLAAHTIHSSSGSIATSLALSRLLLPSPAAAAAAAPGPCWPPPPPGPPNDPCCCLQKPHCVCRGAAELWWSPPRARGDVRG